MHTVQHYNTNMGYVDKIGRTANSYNISHRTWKWTEKLFCHLVDLSVLNSFIIQEVCVGKLTHLQFREQLVCDLILAGQQGATTRKTKPSITPVVPSGNKAYKALASEE